MLPTHTLPLPHPKTGGTCAL